MYDILFKKTRYCENNYDIKKKIGDCYDIIRLFGEINLQMYYILF